LKGQINREDTLDQLIEMRNHAQDDLENRIKNRDVIKKKSGKTYDMIKSYINILEEIIDKRNILAEAATASEAAAELAAAEALAAEELAVDTNADEEDLEHNEDAEELDIREAGGTYLDATNATEEDLEHNEDSEELDIREAGGTDLDASGEDLGHNVDAEELDFREAGGTDLDASGEDLDAVNAAEEDGRYLDASEAVLDVDGEELETEETEIEYEDELLLESYINNVSQYLEKLNGKKLNGIIIITDPNEKAFNKFITNP
jgi:hypothetical protein